MDANPKTHDQERWCDVVMEGGITSGIVYPTAIVELSRHYKFVNIGGTSAGAIAAAATAAAELGRRRGSSVGFRLLSELPEELGTVAKGQSKLFSLFTPESSTRPLFRLLAAALNRKTAWGRFFAVILYSIRGFWFQAASGVAGVVVPLLVFRPWPVSTWVAAAVLAALAGFAGVACGIYWKVTRTVVANGFGLCKGYTKGAETRYASGSLGEPLTLWLSRLINRCAGRKPDDPPVTFGDLRQAKGFPPEWLSSGSGGGPAIRLEMMSTNLTHGRPYRFPLTNSDDRLFFKEEELAKYFPANVVEHLKNKAAKYQPTESDPGVCPAGLLQLPTSDDLPIVFAARLSLSFPFLISAVPLWAIDYEPKRELREFRRCWFSDGGIASNFPIHFFDSPLPLWPTFGIQLEPALKYRPPPAGRLFMPSYNSAGRADPWFRFDEEENGAKKLGGFAKAIFGAAQNWRDRTDARCPGVRDRVVRIRLKDDEGGLNLNMPKALVLQLSDLGKNAAEEIVSRFVSRQTPSDGSHPMDFDNHRWLRMRCLLAALEEHMNDLTDGLRVTPPGTLSWAELLQRAIATQSDKDQYGLSAEEVRQVTKVLGLLETLGVSIGNGASTVATAPKRVPIMRIIPDF